MPNGRLMVNCGGIDEAADVIDGVVHPNNSSIDGTWCKIVDDFSEDLSAKTVRLSSAMVGFVVWFGAEMVHRWS